MILRKCCSGCETVAEEYDIDENHRNAFGNLGGWLYAAGGWWCPKCKPLRDVEDEERL